VVGLALTADGGAIFAAGGNGLKILSMDGDEDTDRVPPVPFNRRDRFEAVHKAGRGEEVVALVQRENECLYRRWDPGSGVWWDAAFVTADRRVLVRPDLALTVQPGGTRLTVWEPPWATTLTRRLKEDLVGRAVSTSSDGTRVAALGSQVSRPEPGRPADPVQNHCFVQVYDGRTIAPYSKMVASNRVRGISLAVSPDGSRVAVGAEGQGAEVFISDVLEDEQLTFRPIGRHQFTIWALAFRPDGRRLATGSSDGTVVEWDPEGLGPPSRPLKHPTTVKALTYIDNGRRLVTGDYAGGVRVWDLATGASVHEFTVGANVTSLAASADDELVAVGTVSGWEVRRLDGGEAVFTSPAGCGTIGGIRFVEPGRLLVVGEVGLNRGITCYNTRLWRIVGTSVEQDGGLMGVSGPASGPTVHLVTATGQLARRRVISPD
jgi:WD40 repeat protein